MKIRQSIARFIQQNGPQTRGDLAEQFDTEFDGKQLSNALYQMTLANIGQLVKTVNEGITYFAPGPNMAQALRDDANAEPAEASTPAAPRHASPPTKPATKAKAKPTPAKRERRPDAPAIKGLIHNRAAARALLERSQANVIAFLELMPGDRPAPANHLLDRLAATARDMRNLCEALHQ